MRTFKYFVLSDCNFEPENSCVPEGMCEIHYLGEYHEMYSTLTGLWRKNLLLFNEYFFSEKHRRYFTVNMFSYIQNGFSKDGATMTPQECEIAMQVVDDFCGYHNLQVYKQDLLTQ